MNTKTMKINYQALKTTTLSVFAGAIVLAAGCKLFGSNPTPPTPTEARLFDITTNTTPQVVTQTNIVTSVKVVTVTNEVGIPVMTTNVFNTTNVVTTTNQVPDYQYTPKPAIESTISAAGTASGPFTAGWGTIAAGALSLLYGAWAHLRSTKSTATSSVLAQEIEAIRTFILTLPQGTKIDSAVTQFMQQHQVEAGVASQVLNLIKGFSSDSTVVGVAAQLQDAINALTAPPKT